MAIDDATTRIAIIGGGVAGLSAAYDLTRSARTWSKPGSVTVYEASGQLGGLAAGFRGRPQWEWPLEHFYHHLFLSDSSMFALLDDLAFAYAARIYRPTTAIHVGGQNYALDSIGRVLQFPLIPLLDRLRMGMVLAYLRFHPFRPWREFEKVRADQWLQQWMGRRAYEAVWRFQLQGKFGGHYQDVNLAWFWARVVARTTKLAYFDGGFQAFVDRLASQVEVQGATIRLCTPVAEIARHPDGGLQVVDTAGESTRYDAVLSTTSPALLNRMVPELPDDYRSRLGRLKSMGAVVLTVALDRPLTENLYWISLPKREGIPFLALVEHTNMVDPKHYGGDHLLYLGDYLDPDHRYFEMDADELVDEFAPHLPKFNRHFSREWITGAWVHSARYAQPVPPVGYSTQIPDIRTPLYGLYFASMSQVYPWDRGTNFAVEIGRRAAGMIAEDVLAMQQ